MNKKEKRGYVIAFLAVAVFSVIAFMLETEHNVVFWFGYVFGVLAVAFQIYIFRVAFAHSEDVRSRFYGLSLLQIGKFYLVMQLCISIAEIVFADRIPYIAAVIVNSVLFFFAVSGSITGEIVREEIERQDENIKQQVSRMRLFQTMMAGTLAKCLDGEVKALITPVAEAIKYSDPVSSQNTKKTEDELEILLQSLDEKIIQKADADEIRNICNDIKVKLAERNILCMQSKRK